VPAPLTLNALALTMYALAVLITARTASVLNRIEPCVEKQHHDGVC
jgi:hypothetical protein